MAHTTTPEELTRLRGIAESLDCLTEEDFQLLADCTSGTAEAWRKRGTGPEYIRLGNRYLYPRKPLTTFLHSRVRERREVPAKAML